MRKVLVVFLKVQLFQSFNSMFKVLSDIVKVTFSVLIHYGLYAVFARYVLLKSPVFIHCFGDVLLNSTI